MSIKNKLPLTVVATFIIGGLIVFAAKLPTLPNRPSVVAVKVSDLSGDAKAGQAAFEVNCAVCHGKNAAGSDKGPPLVHNIYNPGHHADFSFAQAVRKGVKRHHWSFGDMPAQPQVKRSEIGLIIQYVRELQIANGIQYQKHQM